MQKKIGIKNKLITNGSLLIKNDEKENIYDNLDYLALSIDSINKETNVELGRGENHYNNIKTILDDVKNKDIEVNINTVINKKNINELDELGEFLDQYKINTWKFFKFMPLRETAEKNKEIFEITDQEFEKKKDCFKKFKNINNINYKKEEELEESILIISNGDIIKTENGIDRKKGNALYQNVMEIIDKEGEYKMEKIRAVIAHDNEKIRNNIISSMKDLDYVEVVGVATSGIDTYNKMIELKPEIVFSKYNYSDISGMELMEKTKEQLKEEFPTFNLIGDISNNEILKVMKLTERRLNAFVRPPDYSSVKEILQAYREYKYQ